MPHFFCSRLLHACVLLCSLLAAAPSMADAIRVGVSSDADSPLRAFTFAWTEETARQSGLTFELHPGTWKENMALLDEGRLDFIAHAIKTPSRTQRYLFSRMPLGLVYSTLYSALSGLTFDTSTLPLINGKSVGVYRGSAQLEEFIAFAQAHKLDCPIVEFPDPAAVKQALEDGRIDLAALTNHSNTHGRPNVVFSKSFFYFMGRPENDGPLRRTEEALHAVLLRNPSYLSDLYEKHFGTTYPLRQQSLTSAEKTFLKKHPSFRVVCTDSQAPLIYQDERGNFHGLIVDILDRVSQATGVHFEYSCRADAGREDLLQNREADIAVLEIPLAASAPLAGLAIGAALLDSELVPAARDDFVRGTGPVRFAVPEHSQSIARLARYYFPDAERVEVSNAQEALRAVNENTADFFLYDKHILRAMLRNPQYENLTFAFGQAIRSGVFACTRQEYAPLLSIIDKEVARISQQERTRMLERHTLGSPYRTNLLDFVYKYRSLLNLFVLLLIVGISVTAGVISHLHRQNRRLDEALRAAAVAGKAKDSFLADMSHELRTPIAAILGLADPEEKQQDTTTTLRRIHHETQHLLAIVNDILDISKINSGVLTISRQRVPLAPMLDDMRTTYVRFAALHDVALTVRNDLPPALTLYSDETRLRQILVNLLSNAIKYNKSGGSVDLLCTLCRQHGQEPQLRISVTDTGIGIPEKHLADIFSPFIRMENAVAFSEGTGLGLAVTSSVVRLMGGTISVKSRVGEGSTFTVLLPAELAPEQTVASPAAADTADLTGLRVLAAEDNAINAAILSRLLHSRGVDADMAANGAIACERFANAPLGYYDAILLDIRMPVMDGCTAARSIRAMSRQDAAGVPIFALSANAYADDKKRSLDSGMNAHLSKPVDKQELFTLLAQCRQQEGPVIPRS